jgi:cold-inducible RNA-binding protein
LKRLFVGNIPYQASEVQLQEWFTTSGIHAGSVNLIRDRASGEPRGFGFIELSSDAEADQAIRSCNGKDFMGRALVVNEARPAPDGDRRRSGNFNRVGRGA